MADKRNYRMLEKLKKLCSRGLSAASECIINLKKHYSVGLKYMKIKYKQLRQKSKDYFDTTFSKVDYKAFLYNRKLWVITFSIIMMFAIVLYSIFAFSLSPVEQNEKTQIIFHVKKGMTAEDIALKLKELKLLRSKGSFILYTKIKGFDKRIKAGKYLISPNMSVQAILEKLVTGDAIKESIKITIPEGFTLKQIASLLDKKGLVVKKEFIKNALVGNFKYEFLQGLSPDTPLEGYLFPDTYNFPVNAGVKTVISIMLDRFDQILNESYRKRAEELDRSLHEIVTIASIIEKEAARDEERPVISSVFYNRLKIGKPLQSCATVQYALGEWKETLLYEDLEIESPYNTYKHAGLPPGPISNPGKASIHAALYPEDTEYLYFVSKGDGSHKFSKTYSEHLRAIRTFQQTK